MSTEEEQVKELEGMALAAEAIDSDDESDLQPPPPPGEASGAEDSETSTANSIIDELSSIIQLPESKPPAEQPTPSAAPESLLGNPSDEIESKEASSGVEPSQTQEETPEPPAADTPIAGFVDEDSSTVSAPTVSESSIVSTIKSTLLSLKSKPPKERKTKIEQRLTKVLEDAITADGASKLDDLSPLIKKYQALRKELRALIKIIKDYRTATLKMETERNKLFAKYASLSADTPLFDHVGKLPESEDPTSNEEEEKEAPETTEDGLELQGDSVQQIATDLEAVSLATLQQLARTNEGVNDTEYQTYVIDYAEEWEDVVTRKVEFEIKEVQKLMRNKTHYERKVASLQNKHDSLQKKEKGIPLTVTDKLSRNLEKRASSQEECEQRAKGLCALLEEVVLHGWKDWFLLIKNSMRYEMNRLGRENASYGRLPATLEAMIQQVPAPAPTEDPKPALVIEAEIAAS